MDSPGATADIFHSDLLSDDPHYNFSNKMSIHSNDGGNQESFFSN